MTEESKDEKIIIDVDSSEEDDEGVDPTVMPEDADWKEQSATLMELQQLLQQRIPQNEPNYNQTQAAAKLGIPRTSIPKLVNRYEKIAESLRFLIKSDNGTVLVSERGMEFFRLVRKLRLDFKLPYTYLDSYIQSVIDNRPLTHSLNQSDFEMIATIVRQMMQAYTDKIITPSIQEKDKQIQRLAAENAELKSLKSMVEDQSGKKDSQIKEKDDQIVQLTLENTELKSSMAMIEDQAKMYQDLLDQNEKLSSKVDALMDRFDEEHKGFFSRIFGR